MDPSMGSIGRNKEKEEGGGKFPHMKWAKRFLQVPDNERESAGSEWRLSEGGGWRGELSLKSLV